MTTEQMRCCFNSNNALTVFETPTAAIPQSRNSLSAPSETTAKPIDEHSIHLTWHGVQDAVSYTLYRGKRENALEKIRDGIRETYFTDTGLTTGQTYWYAIASRNSNGTTFKTIYTHIGHANATPAAV